MDRKATLLIAGAGAAAGFYGVMRALRGRQTNTLPYGHGIKLKKAVTVNRPAAELYNYWRDMQNLSSLFENVTAIESVSPTLSRWNFQAPGGVQLSWNAEITIDRPNEMIGWRSTDGADLDSAGYVRFEPATGGRGTVVRVALQYNPPAGKVGAAISSVLGEKPASQIEEALRRFKRIMETVEIPSAANEGSVPVAMYAIVTRLENGSVISVV